MPVFFDQHSLPITVGAGSVGTGVLTIADAAALAAYDDTTLDNGALAFVETYKDYFQKIDTSKPIPANPNVVIPASSGNAAWYRLEIPSTYWQSQTDWFIDALNGNDQYGGASKSDALATFAEFNRRVQQILATVTVNILEDTAEHFVGNFESADPDGEAKLVLRGAKTIYVPGGIIDTAVAPDPSAAINDYGVLTAHNGGGPIDWTTIAPTTQNFVEVTASANPAKVGLQTVIFGTGAGPTFAQTPCWANAQTNGQIDLPQAGDTIDVFQIRSVGSIKINAPNVVVQVKYLAPQKVDRFSSLNAKEGTLFGQEAYSGFYGCALVGIYAADSNYGFYGCFLLTGIGMAVVGTGSITYKACGFAGGMTFFAASVASVDGSICVGGNGVAISGNSVKVVIGSNGFGCFNSAANGLRVADSSVLIVNGPLYGETNTQFGLLCERGGVVNVLGTLAEPADLSLTGTIAALRVDPPAGVAAGQIVPLVAGIPTAPAANLATWADWTAVNRQAVNLASGSRIFG